MTAEKFGFGVASPEGENGIGNGFAFLCDLCVLCG